MTPGIRYSVYSIRKTKTNSSIWVRAGVAYVNKDSSMNVYLDVLPIEGQLHIREAAEKRELPPPVRQQATETSSATATTGPEAWASEQSMGGH